MIDSIINFLILSLQQVQSNFFFWGITFILGFASGITLQTRKDIDFLDLVCTDGKLDRKKLWENIALAVGVWAFIYSVYMNYVGELLWLLFLGVYTGNDLIHQIIQFRYGASGTTLQEEPEKGNKDA